MPSACSSHSTNMGYCEKCHGVVPVARAKRDNWLYLTRDCPKCGPTETLISRDAKAYYEKRELLGYEGDAVETCALNCVDCGHGVAPYYVVIDVTNRCNMNCPICLANIPAMGMEFNPPIEYFERIFRLPARPFARGPRSSCSAASRPAARTWWRSSKMAQRDMTCSPRVVTNGLKLADEEYCQRSSPRRCQLMLGLDGLNPEIQTQAAQEPRQPPEEAEGDRQYREAHQVEDHRDVHHRPGHQRGAHARTCSSYATRSATSSPASC